MFSKTTVLKKISSLKDVSEFYKYLSGSYSYEVRKQRRKEFKEQFKKDPDIIQALWEKFNMYVALEYATRGNPYFNNLEVAMKLLTCDEGIRYVPSKLRKKEEVMKKYLDRCMTHGFNPEGIIKYVKPNCPHLLENAKWKKYVKTWAKNRPIPINSSINF